MSALKPDGQGNHDLGTTDNRWGALHVQTIATSGDVSVGGALSVSGGITTVKEQELIIGDSMIQLGDGETTNSKDIGFFGEYNDGSSQTFAGLVYDQSASKFFLFSSLTSQPSDTINTGHESFTKATLDLADIDTVTFTATGAASLGSTLGVTGAVSLASTLDVDGNTTLDGLAVSEAATFASTLGVTGEASLDGGIDVDESGSSVFSVHGTSGNTSVGGTLGVTGASTLASVGVTNNATVGGTLGVTGEASLDGGIDVEESGSSVFSVNGTSGNTAIVGTLDVDGNTTLDVLAVAEAATFGTTLGVTGESTLASAIIQDLTSGRVVLAGTAGAVEDSDKLTFNGTTLAVTGAATISSTLSAGETTLSSATISDLTSGRVVLAGTDGAIEDNGNLTFNGSTLAVTGAATVSSDLTVTGALDVDGATTLDGLAVSEAATFASTLGVTGEASLDGGIDVDESGSSVFSVHGTSGNTSVGGTLAVTSNATVGGTLGVTGEASLDGGIDVDESGSSVFSVHGTSGNTAIAGTLDVDGATTLDGLTVSEGASFQSTLDVDGATTLDGLTVSEAATFQSTLAAGETTLSSATISDLTSGRVVLAGTAGAVEDSNKLTFNGSTLAVTGAATVSSDLTVSGALDVDGTTSLDGVSVDGSSTLTGAVGITGTTTLNSASDLIIKDNAGTPATVFSVTGASGNTTIAGTLGVTGNTTIGGNLTVNGTTTTVNSTTVTIDDPIFTLGGDTAPSEDDNKDRGIEFRWHTEGASGEAKVGFFGFDDSAEKFTFIPDATNSSEVFSGTAGDVAFGAGQFSSMLANSVQIGNTANTIDTASGNLILKGASGQKVQIDDTLQVTGAATLDSTLLVSGEASLDGGIDVEESGSSVFSVNGASGNTAIAGTLAVTGATGIDGNFDINTNKFTVASASGDTVIAGTLGASGAATLSSTLDVTGATGINGDFDINTDKFTVASSTGNTAIAGTLAVAGATGIDGDFDINTNKFTVASSSGDTAIAGTLGVTGAATLSSTLNAGATTLTSVGVTNNATVGGTLGVTAATTLSSTLDVTGATGIDGDFDINSNKFTVASSTGNTAIAGTLDVTGATGIDGDFDINSNKFTVASSTGNTAIAGTLGVTGAATLSSTVGISGKVTVNGTTGLNTGTNESLLVKHKSGASSDTAIEVVINDSEEATGLSKFKVDSSGNVTMSGTLTVTDSISSGGDTLEIADSLISFNKNATANKDIGFYGKGNDNKFMGLIYDVSLSDKRFRLYDQISTDPGTGNTVTFSSGEAATLEVGALLLGKDADGADRKLTFGHSTVKTVMGIDDDQDVFAIHTNSDFEAANDLEIDASGNLTLGNGNLTIGADADDTDRKITFGHSTCKTIIGIDDDQDVFAIHTNADFTASNDLEINSSGDVNLGLGDLTLSGSGKGLTLTKAVVDGIDEESTQTVSTSNQKSFQVIVKTDGPLNSGATSVEFTVTNSSALSTSVILGTCVSHAVEVIPHTVSNGTSFKFTLVNRSDSAIGGDENLKLNFVII